MHFIVMQCNAMQCNAMQCNAMQCNAMQCNAMQCHATQRNATQCNATQRNATQYNAMQCNAMQCHATQRNATQRNATQRNPMQCNAMVQWGNAKNHISVGFALYSWLYICKFVSKNFTFHWNWNDYRIRSISLHCQQIYFFMRCHYRLCFAEMTVWMPLLSCKQNFHSIITTFSTAFWAC